MAGAAYSGFVCVSHGKPRHAPLLSMSYMQVVNRRGLARDRICTICTIGEHLPCAYNAEVDSIQAISKCKHEQYRIRPKG